MSKYLSIIETRVMKMMGKRNRTACFTGHRTLREPENIIVDKLTVILKGLIEQGYCYFGAGGARGFDSIAARVVLTLKADYPHIHLILVLPFYNQYEFEQGWSSKEIEEYKLLQKSASKVVHLQETYSRGCYYRRNEHLVNGSSLCIAYQYKDSGGTAYTTKYAASQGIRIIKL